MRLKKYIAEGSGREAIWLLKNKFSRSRYVKLIGGIETQNHLLPAPRAPRTHTTKPRITPSDVQN